MKKVFKMMLAGSIAAVLLTSSTHAGEIKISGDLNAYMASISNNDGSDGLAVGVDSAGTDNTYGFMRTLFNESELKFKGKTETANGWKTYFEIELELKESNSFDLEEASINVDFGGFQLSLGRLEDWGAVTGAVYNWGIDEQSSIFKDETESVRLAITGVENLKADLKIRMYGEETTDGSSDFIANYTETRIQAQYSFGIGSARLIYATLSASPHDADAAGDWAHSKTAMELGATLKFGAVSPFFSYLTKSEKETAAASGSDEEETQETQTIIGLDFAMSDTQTLTFNYLSNTQDELVDGEGMDTPFARTSLGIGAAFDFEPVTFYATYAATTNNYKEAKDTGENATASAITAGAFYSF